MTIAFRPVATAEERMFVAATWSSSFKSSHYAGILFTDDYAPAMHRTIARVLDRPEASAILAVDPEDENFFFGHIVGEVEAHETPIIHYVFVKGPYRKRGYARALFEAIGVNPMGYYVFTCPTHDSQELFERGKMPRARHDPNGIRYSKANRRDPL